MSDTNSPSVIGKYVRTQTLGRGAYGEVSLFRYSGTSYAIKRISMLDIISTITEISMYTILSHPHIMKPYEVIPDDITLNIVMKYVPRNLLSWIRKHEDVVDNDEVKMIIWQLLSAVAYMHSNDIIHRDLKPENILIEDSKMYTYIIDFGLARYLFPGSGEQSQRVQTVEYRAPEVFLSGNYGKPIDIYSLGVIMYEMLFMETVGGNMRTLKGRGGSDAMLHASISERIDLARYEVNSAAMPQDMKDVILSMLHADPNMRSNAQAIMDMPWFSDMSAIEPNTINLPTYVPNTTESPFKGITTDPGAVGLAGWVVRNSKGVFRSMDNRQAKNQLLVAVLAITGTLYNEAKSLHNIQLVISGQVVDRNVIARSLIKVFRELEYNIYALPESE